jgi:hypothetical protein
MESIVRPDRRDLRSMGDLVANEAQICMQRSNTETGRQSLREALLVADHNTYHLGQLVLLKGCSKTG